MYLDDRMSHTSTHYSSDPRDEHKRVAGVPRRWYPRFDPAVIASNAFDACDSGGHYWVSKNVDRHHAHVNNINRACDAGITTDAVGRTSVFVNGGGYGYGERQAYAAFINRYRGDGTETTANKSFTVSHATKTYSVYVDFTAQRPR